MQTRGARVTPSSSCSRLFWVLRRRHSSMNTCAAQPRPRVLNLFAISTQRFEALGWTRTRAVAACAVRGLQFLKAPLNCGA